MKIRNILLLSALVMLSACFKDDTSPATGSISEITIVDGTVEAVYDIDKNQTLTVTPQVIQTMSNQQITYTWEVDQKVHSHAKEFVFVGNELGTFQCRLVVENEDGKAFFPFELNVNSPYEEGITVLSYDENGKSMLSFMLKQRAEGVEEFFMDENSFEVNNPEEPFASYAVDMQQSGGSLILLCRGDENKGEPGTIYFIDEKTFVLENVLYVSEYSDFRPLKMFVPANGSAGTAYPILCENGKVYELSTIEGAIGEAAKFKSTYALGGMIYDSGSAMYNNMYLWDNVVGGLAMNYNGYGPYFFSTGYHAHFSDQGELVDQNGQPTTTYFDAGEKPIFMCLVKTLGKSSPYSDVIILITQKGMYRSYNLGEGYWRYNEETGNNDLLDGGGAKLAGPTADLNLQTPHVATTLYSQLYYATGNKIKRWNYEQRDWLNKAKEHAVIGSADAIITAMELSSDHLETYVAFYEPNETGKNGHVWIIDTETGEVKRKYANVAYRPTKIIYKKK